MTTRFKAMIGVVLALGASTAGAQIQGDGERARQAGLPQSGSAYWSLLRRTKIGMDEARGRFTASHPAAVKALAGQTITMTGFMLPLDAGKQVRHFLLSKYTPVCAFCPPGEPNEVVEVTAGSPVPYRDKLVSVTGKFALADNGEQGLFFRLGGARVN